MTVRCKKLLDRCMDGLSHLSQICSLLVLWQGITLGHFAALWQG